MNLKFGIDVPENVTKLIEEPIDNLAKKPTASIGKGISSIIDLVFMPFQYGKDKLSVYYQNKLETYKKELIEKEKSIPEDKIEEPDFQTVAVAVENSKYCITNDDLRNMFVNLIGNSIHKDKKKFVHPAFAEIIKQMTSIDANVIAQFKYNESLPILELRKIDSYSNSYSVIFTNFFIHGGKYKLINDLAKSITNLNRLGIINISYSKYFTDDRNYNEIIEIANSSCEIFEINSKDMNIQKGIASLTSFGKEFIDACLPD